MSTETRDTPDNPYRKRDPWGARSTVPQVFTVQAPPAPVRRVFKPAPPTAQAPRSLLPDAPRADRLQLTPVAEPYDEPPPRREETQPSPDPVSTRRPPFAGAAPLPTTERKPFVGAAPPTTPARTEAPKPVAPRVEPPVTAPPSRPAPFARSQPAPKPAPAVEAKRSEPETPRTELAPAPRPVPAAAVAPPVGGFGFERRARRGRRPLPRGLLAASLIVLAGVAAVAAVVVLKPWGQPSAIDTLAAQGAKAPAPLTITPATDSFAANATSQTPAAPGATPVKTATASLVPHTGSTPSASASGVPTSGPAVVPTLIDAGAPAPNAASLQPAAGQPAASPPKAAPAPIVVTPASAQDAKPAAAQPEPVKASPPPAKPAGELISTSHLPGDSVGPHQ